MSLRFLLLLHLHSSIPSHPSRPLLHLPRHSQSFISSSCSSSISRSSSPSTQCLYASSAFIISPASLLHHLPCHSPSLLHSLVLPIFPPASLSHIACLALSSPPLAASSLLFLPSSTLQPVLSLCRTFSSPLPPNTSLPGRSCHDLPSIILTVTLTTRHQVAGPSDT